MTPRKGWKLIKMDLKVRLYLLSIGLSTVLTGWIAPITTLRGMETAIATIWDETIETMRAMRNGTT